MANKTVEIFVCGKERESLKVLTVVSKPLMKENQVVAVSTLAILILFAGLLINSRIYKILLRRKNTAAIDKIFMTSTISSLLFQPLILAYYVASYFVYPMSNYIGTIGCLATVHLLDVYVRFYNFCYPVSIALVRYLFVVKHIWVKSKGMHSVVNSTIALSFIIPIIMVITVQFPIFDSVHGPYNRCIGRFETYFNPLDLDTITPGLRGGVNQCIETEQWAFDPNVGSTEFPFRIILYLGCKATTHIFWVVMLSAPEIILYALTFNYIIQHTNNTELSGILNPEVIKKRRQQNKLNITMTFWAWVAQFMTNIMYMAIMKIFYGRDRFFHAILTVFTISLNFNVLPLFYIAMVDDDFKLAIMQKDYWGAFKLFLTF